MLTSSVGQLTGMPCLPGLVCEWDQYQLQLSCGTGAVCDSAANTGRGGSAEGAGATAAGEGATAAERRAGLLLSQPQLHQA